MDRSVWWLDWPLSKPGEGVATRLFPFHLQVLRSGALIESSLMRVNDAAQLLKVSKWTIYRWIEEGRLRATKIGRGSLRMFRTSVGGLIEEARIDRPEAQDGSRSKEPSVRVTGQKKEK